VIRRIYGSAEAILRWMTSQPHSVASVGFLRMMIGIVSTAFFLRHYAERGLFFGPQGVYGIDALREQLELTGSFSLYSLTDASWWFELCFHAGLVTSVAVAIGVGGRSVLAAHYVLLWSLFMTNPSFMDGGDAVLSACTVFLLCTRCYSRFTLVPDRLTDAKKTDQPVVSVLHNTGVLLIAAQLCIVYLMAGLYKVQGTLWQDGTALYYILRVPEFFWPGVTPLLFSQGWLMVISAYGVVLASIFFPVLVFFQAGRGVAVIVMIALHAGIGLMMGLTSFALIMIAADTVFVNIHVENGRLEARRALRQVSGRIRHAIPFLSTSRS
jgi:hypothetical protein